MAEYSPEYHFEARWLAKHPTSSLSFVLKCLQAIDQHSSSRSLASLFLHRNDNTDDRIYQISQCLKKGKLNKSHGSKVEQPIHGYCRPKLHIESNKAGKSNLVFQF